MAKQIEPTVSPRVGLRPNSGMKRWLSAAALAVLIHFVEAPRIRAQVSAPAFEVASVKLTDSRTGYIRTEPGRLTARGRTLANLILRAYSLQDYQLTHGPAVSLAETCDIDAKAEGPAEPEQLYQMLQTLLTDRFKLVVHHEMKELPVFVLSVGKNLPKLHEAKDGEAPAMRYEPSQPGDRSFLQLVGRRVSLALLARFLGSQLRRPVFDETGLKGEFDFTAELTALAPASGDSSPPVKGTAVDPSSVIAAIRDDLGLKLESGKRQVDVLVVDHVEKLSAN
jgi:uncharacterized protein (TIGR03435 family)